MDGIFRKCARALPLLGLVLGLSACASASQSPVLTADAVLRVADLTRAEGDLVSAAGLYQKAHEIAPTDARPLIELGRTLARMGSSGAAAEAYRAALQIDGSDAEARRGLGLTLLNTGQPEAAITEFEKALDRGEDYRLYNGIGVAYDMVGDHEAAQTYYRSALRLAPANLDVTNNLGLSLMLEGRYQEGISLLEQAAADPMAPPRFRQNLALAYGLAGDKDRARQLAQRDLDPDTVERNLTYFDVLKGLGDDRTMASALGAHLADPAPLAPAGEPTSATGQPPTSSPAASAPISELAPVQGGTEGAPSAGAARDDHATTAVADAASQAASEIRLPSEMR
ncbi:MAG: tetratricopeptide repeat protein [Pseudomonadota bacterium]